MVFQALSNLTRLQSRANEEAQPELQRTACAVPPVVDALPRVRRRTSKEGGKVKKASKTRRAGRGWPISHFHRAPAFRRKHLNVKRRLFAQPSSLSSIWKSGDVFHHVAPSCIIGKPDSP